ncbi:MAG: HAD family hydrolase [Chloroflexota bacterium]
MNPKPTFSAFLFDFDYTLADSSQGILECANFALAGLGLPAARAEAVYATIGKSLPDTLAALAGQEHTARTPEFVRLFVQRADEVMVDRTVLYESTAATLHTLKAHGKKLGIVSTKYRYRIVDTLQREKLDTLPDVIVGGEDVQRHKPDPQGLYLALERLGNLPSEVLYIGDSLVDAETAQRAGVAFAAVLTGATRRSDFEQYPCVAVVESLASLESFL